ncbi:MAG TPA: hypothetical protein VI873_01720 [Candidatus Peribacteraceae bacterium]|nr:hypothetical protein [Candidatus Peribacteraceae bacterium]
MFKQEVINEVSMAGVGQGAMVVREIGQQTKELLPEGSGKLSVGLKLRDAFEWDLSDVSDREHLVTEHVDRMRKTLGHQYGMSLMGEESRQEQKNVAQEFGPKIKALQGLLLRMEQEAAVASQ